MKQTFIYIGLNVSDSQYHGSVPHKHTGEIIYVKCRPTLKGLVYLFKKPSDYFPEHRFTLCYEATYIGYLINKTIKFRHQLIQVNSFNYPNVMLMLIPFNYLCR